MGAPYMSFDLEKAQQTFLRRFDKSILPSSTVASRDATASSSRRSHLYRRGLTQKQRNLGPRLTWTCQIDRFLLDYIETAMRGEAVTIERFRRDCEHLKRYMNEVCSEFFYSAFDRGFAPGFRLAHAQKSLALKMKHHWCLGEIPEPPCCPIDRFVLRKAGAAPSEVWTRIDNWDSYDRQLAYLEGAADAAGLSLAVWELYIFEWGTVADRTSGS